MTQPPLHRVLALVEEALGLPPDERDTFVERATAGDEALAAAVRAALAAEPPSDFIEPPPPDASTVDAAPDDLLGTRLGDFELVELIGRGGMGVVYRARQVGLERNAAVKVLPSIRRSDPLAVERFKREAIAASRLQHEALVPVLASDTEDDKAWYAMAFVEGHDLHTEIAAQASAEASACLLPAFGSREYETMVALQVARLAEGLEHAHRSGVLHRDVKPRNIMVARDGRMFLTDFGLARVAGGETLTASGAVQGTPHYMSPEQARALRDPVTERSDVYSLGVVLFELLSRRKPFQGEDMQSILAQIASGTHERLRKLNTRVARDLATIAEKAMSHRPGDRYESAGAFAQDLRRFLRSEAIAARPLPAVKRAWRWAERRPWRVAAAVGAVAIAATIWLTAGAQVRASERRAVMAPIERLLETDTPTDAEFSAAWRALQRVEHVALDDVHRSRVARARELVDEDILDRLEAISQGVSAALEPRDDPRYGGARLAPDSTSLPAWLMSAESATGLYPGDERLAQYAALERYLPRVSFTATDSDGTPVAATVFAQRVDRITDDLGEPEDLGSLPLADVRIAPGRYRFTVVASDGRFAEVERDLALAPTHEIIHARPTRWEDVPVELVRISPPVDASPPTAERSFSCLAPMTGGRLGSYGIGRSEVSVAVFLRYLRESGDPPPELWTASGFDAARERFTGPDVPPDFDQERWTTLPVCGVEFRQLTACAEWFGCRLPTHLESEFAQRGPGWRRVPTGIALPGAEISADGPRVSADALPVPDAAVLLLGIQETARRLLPAVDPNAACPPFGLQHPYGNVWEITSSNALIEVGGVVLAREGSRLALGGDFSARRDRFTLRDHAVVGTTRRSLNSSTGLRWAKSSSAPLAHANR